MSEPTDPAAIEQAETELRTEHKQIHELASELRTIKQADDLVSKLSTLHEVLRKHFAHEEYPGGLYDRLGACSGQFREQVRELADEHYEVLSAVQSLRNRLATEGEDGVSDALQVVGDLVSLVKRHETREHQLVADAKGKK